MREPKQPGVDGNSGYPRALQITAPTGATPPPRPRVRAGIDFRRTNSAASRAIIEIVLVLLVTILAYLLARSANPSVNELSPDPGTTTEPGLMRLAAHVSAAKPIQHVTLTVDGQTQLPAVITQDDRNWIVRFQTLHS
ncbi:MAG TPA: hypothetical protein VHV31_10770 [Nitrolancea sp.]|nr:hypothetical protein [Nitrolancea sp.]